LTQETHRKHNYRLADFQFEVPEEKIAQFPEAERSRSKLLILDRKNGAMQHKSFTNIIEFLHPEDVLVVNETRVIPARLFAQKSKSRGQIEIFLLRQLRENTWDALVKPARKVRLGNRLYLDADTYAEVNDNTANGGRILSFHGSRTMADILSSFGQTPLPPYIRRAATAADKSTYQTVFARRDGAAAAPTAGLHFDDQLLTAIRAKGIAVVPILLHVGLGTFRPVKVEDISKHKMHAEYYEVSSAAAATVNSRRAAGGRIIAIGTTAVRTLETCATGRQLREGSGWTDKFIYPPYNFNIVDGLVTNFHTPGSSLLMLVAAMGGYEQVMAAYHHALKNGYRFFSYGDAMLII
jgi:S-adenosylmethionine:tRNA ribosyltransferase-isomerase